MQTVERREEGMASVELINQNAEHVGKRQALLINTAAATGLQNVLKTNLGPKGTLKMLVGGAGQIKLTKDGNTLLHEMQIQHPTATLIARTATATDNTAGDGTTSTVLFTGELMKQAQRLVEEGTHPRVIVDGFDLAREELDKFIRKFKKTEENIVADRELLCSVCRTSLGTKLKPELVAKLTDIVVDAVLTIMKKNKQIDLHMVEILHMLHKFDFDTRLVKGLVLDHGARHPAMPKELKNVYILILNVSLEYEKSELTSNFVYKNAEEREKLVSAERKFTDDKVKKIIDFKKYIINKAKEEEVNKNKEFSFMIINQKGIDPVSLDMLAREGILGLRRAKRRNMERLSLACGGEQVNNVEDLSEEVLGRCEHVYEQVLGEEKFTFVEGVQNPLSCTVLIKGQNPHTVAMVKDGLRDSLRAVKNAIEEKGLVAGAGAFEIAGYRHLLKFKQSVTGKKKLGVQAFAESLLIIPKTLAENSGFDQQETIIKLLEEFDSKKIPIGLDVTSGEPLSPEQLGIWDNLAVKRSVCHLSTALASQLLLVDEIMKAGRGSRPKTTPDMMG